MAYLPSVHVAGPERVIYDGPGVSLTPEYFGMHHHYFPMEGSSGSRIANWGTARLHDFAPTISGASKRVRWDWIESGNWSTATVQQQQDDPGWVPFDLFVGEHWGKRRILHTLFGTHWRYSQDPNEPWAYSPTPPVGQGGGAKPPTDLASGVSSSWGRFCSRMGERTAGKSIHFEVWNEPNLQTFPSRFYSGTHAELSQMTRIAAQAIKAANPQAVIISPAVTSMQVAGSGLAYMNTMMVASDGADGDMRQWIDMVGVHLYPSNTDIFQITGMISRIRAAMTALGIGGKPLFNTEFGLLSPDYRTLPEGKRARLMMRAMLLAGVHPDGGCVGSNWYDADGTVLGFDASDVAIWEDVRAFLLSGPVTRYSVVSDGALRVTCGGVTQVI